MVPESPSENSPLEERRRGFARVINGAAWLFALVAAVGAVQVGRALWSRAVWLDYRGEIVTPAEMWRELVFFALVVIVCAPLAWLGRSAWRRRF